MKKKAKKKVKTKSSAKVRISSRAKKNAVLKKEMNRKIMLDKANKPNHLNSLTQKEAVDIHEEILTELVENQHKKYETLLTRTKANLPWYSLVNRVRIWRSLRFLKKATETRTYITMFLNSTGPEFVDVSPIGTGVIRG